MKKLFLFLFILSSSFCHAQLITGLKLNWNVNRFIIKSANAYEFFDDTGFGIEKSVSFGAGIVSNYKLNKQISIQAELIFNPLYTGFSKSIYDSQGDFLAQNSFEIHMNYIEMPWLAKLSFGNEVTFDVIGGVYFGYLLSAKQSTYNGRLNIPNQFSVDYPTHNVRKDYTSFDMGISGGLGITMHDRVFFELRLNRGIVNINKDGSTKMHTLQGLFTVGCYIFRQKKKE